jgi:hypothetical protein
VPGKRVTKAELERRVQMVFELLCEGAAHRRIVQHLADNGVRVCDRQVAEYEAKARKRLMELFKVRREEFAAEQLSALIHLADVATKERQYSAACGARIAAARMLGIDAPK